MANENVVELKELIEQCEKFLNKEITHEELIEWSKKVVILPFLPIREKMENVMYVLFNCKYSDDVLERFINLEMNKFWYLLLSYTNIELDDDLLTEQNYDLLFAMCYEWIRQAIGGDYEICLNLLKELMDFGMSMDLKTTFDELANTDFSKLIQEDKELVSFLNQNPELIKDISDIVTNTNHDIKNISDVISKQVQNDINAAKNK